MILELVAIVCKLTADTALQIFPYFARKPVTLGIHQTLSINQGNQRQSGKVCIVHVSGHLSTQIS